MKEERAVRVSELLIIRQVDRKPPFKWKSNKWLKQQA